MCDSASHRYICVSGGTAFQDCHFFRAGLVKLHQYRQFILKNTAATYKFKKKLYRLNNSGKKKKKTNAILHYSDCARNCAQGHLNVTEILSQTSITNFTILFYFNFRV